MSWIQPRSVSLLDLANRWPSEWWLVYTDLDKRTPVTRWLSKYLTPGFQHVQAVRRDGRNWIAVYPHLEYVDIQIIRSDETPWQMFKGCSVQHVVALPRDGRIYSPFHVGPWNCVEVVKSLLGIRSWWVRTPWQLFNYVKRNHTHGI
jgi:hypothetical protein